MFKAAFHKPILAIVGAAVVVTMVSAGASFAGGGGGGGGDGNMGRGDFGVPKKNKVSTISSTDRTGTTTSIRSRNGAKTYTVTKTRNGKVVSKKTVAKKQRAFITIHNPDGTSRTVFGRDR